MKNNIFLRILLFGLLAFGLFAAYKTYSKHVEDKRRATFYENLKDTSSPTVTVLRDSILIGYQNKKRAIHIYVPPNYYKDSLTHYPIIYFLDGQASFNDLEAQGPEWQIDEVINAAFEKGKQTAIVVGISNSSDRNAEYTPFVNEDNPNAHGDKFAKWLTTDLKNWIDSNYRTKSETKATTIGGISRSGMMAYYILMAHPDVIGNAIIQSPAMWVDYDRLLAMNLTKEQLTEKKIFISVGSNEGYMISDAEAIYRKFKAKDLDKNALRFELITGGQSNGGHWNMTWRESFALCYPWLMK